MSEIKTGNWSEFEENLDFDLENGLEQNDLCEISELESISWSEDEANAFWNTLNSELFTNPLTLSGSIPAPRFMRDSAGEYLFTPGMIHCVYGAPTSRKSHLVVNAVLEHSGVYIDLETSPVASKRRISKLGYPLIRSNQFAFPTSSDDLRRVVKKIINFPPTLVVFDTFGRMCSLLGLNPSDDQEVGAVFNEFFKPISDAGHAVVFVDHLPKKGTTKEFPFGSQNKKSQSDVLLLLEVKNEYESSIYLMKDRHFIFGERGIFEGVEFGMVCIDQSTGRTFITRLLDTESVREIERLRREEKIETDICAAVTKFGPITKSDLKLKVRGNNKIYSDTVNRLILEGKLISNRAKASSGKTVEFLQIAENLGLDAEGGHSDDL